VQRQTIELYGTQHDFVACQDRFTGFIGGIGSGKSYAGAVKAMLYSQTPGTLGLVIAPSYPMLRDATLRTFRQVAEATIAETHASEMRLTLRNGAEVLFRSADQPDRLRGPNISWAWIDEASLCGAETWEITIGRLRADGKAGPCWITTTPKGRNWVYQRQAQMTVFRSTTAGNPYLSREFVESLYAAYEGKFAQQELLGEFVGFDGLVYDEFDRGRNVKTVPTRTWTRVFAGVDEGYTNPAVILIVGEDHDGRLHVMHEFYQRRRLQAEVVNRQPWHHVACRWQPGLDCLNPGHDGVVRWHRGYTRLAQVGNQARGRWVGHKLTYPILCHQPLGLHDHLCL
jgi:phage terminase large subunit